MIRISVFGKESDLNRELSKRGLMRVAGTDSKYRPEDGDHLISCFIHGNYQTSAYKKLKRWFTEGCQPYDHAFPRRKMFSSNPGHLESYSVW